MSFTTTPTSSLFYSHTHFHSSSNFTPFNSQTIFLSPKSKKQRRALSSLTVSCTSDQDVSSESVWRKKRAFLFLGFSVLPFLPLTATALDNLFSKEKAVKKLVKNKNALLSVQVPPSSFVTLLNGLGIFGTGILGALYALAQKEKKETDETIESMENKLKESEAAIASLKSDFESKLLREQEERARQLKKANEEQQLVLNQLNSANSTISGLGHELKNEKRVIEKMRIKIDGLGSNLLKVVEEKKTLEQELKEKLSSIEILQYKVSSLSSQLEDKERQIQALNSSLAEKEIALKNLNSANKQTRDDLTKAYLEIKEKQVELLKNKKELDLKISAIDELNSSVNSLTVEREESIWKLNALQEKYNCLESSSAEKATLDAKLLEEREDELQELKERLELSLNEVRQNQAEIGDLTKERNDLSKAVVEELSNVKNLKIELTTTLEALEKSRGEASDVSKQLKESTERCGWLENELSRVQAAFTQVTETLEKTVNEAKHRDELLTGELADLKDQLKKAREELQIASHELVAVTESRDSLQEELLEASRKAELLACELKVEKDIASSLNKEIQILEKQIAKDKEARKSLETDLEEATKSLDELNRNVFTLSQDLEMANSQISNLEHEKDVLYKSLTEYKTAAKEAKENMEDAHNLVLSLGKERDSLEKKAKKLQEELASAKGEILRLRSQMNSSKTSETNDDLQESENGKKATVTARRIPRRRRNSTQ